MARHLVLLNSLFLPLIFIAQTSLAQTSPSDCPQALNCPMDGQTYFVCTAGRALNGCQPSQNGPFPSFACSSQCLFTSTNPLYLPAPCPSTTVHNCPSIPGMSFFYCSSLRQCRPTTQGWFPVAACPPSSQCLVSTSPPLAASSPPSLSPPKPHPPPPPKLSPPPPLLSPSPSPVSLSPPPLQMLTYAYCPESTACPTDGSEYYFCSAGPAVNGCSSTGPFPATACSNQCVYQFSSDWYLPMDCSASTPAACPKDGQQYYYCQQTGGCRPVSTGQFPPEVCPSQCILPAVNATNTTSTGTGTPTPTTPLPTPSSATSSPTLQYRYCQVETSCPTDGTEYHFCTAGPAKNGCSSSGPFPVAACSDQCVYQFSSDWYLPMDCSASTPAACPKDGQQYYYCQQTGGCRPVSTGQFPPDVCPSQCILPAVNATNTTSTGTGTFSPSPQSASSPLPSPSPPPPASGPVEYSFCMSTVQCPKDGLEYHYCSSGISKGGCRLGGPFPVTACSDQCVYQFSSDWYLPMDCSASTPAACPQDGQQYYYCQQTGGCRPLSAGHFPPEVCPFQCIIPAVNATSSSGSGTSGGGSSSNQSRDRTFNIINRCSAAVDIGTIAYLNNDPSNPTIHPSSPTPSFHIAAALNATTPSVLKLTVKSGTSGRLWARTGCATDPATGKFSCKTGDCGNEKVCSLSGKSPATLFEWTFENRGLGSRDIYDLSAVDGYNLPMTISPTGAYSTDVNNQCTAAGCSLDTNLCPPETRLQVGEGAPTACFSICAAVWDEAQRASYPVLQDLFTARNPEDGKRMRDLVCCACGDACTETCTGCGDSNCAYGCSPYVTTYATPPFTTSVCRVEAWPLATNGRTYIEAVKQSCPGTYSWQFDDEDGLHYCIAADYDVTLC